MKHIVLLVLVSGASLFLLGAADEPAAAPAPDAPAKAFEQFKRLEGVWEGRSTKGWVSRTTYSTIAGGSCVMENEFGAHPNEAMITMFHMDGPHLMLTHYCMARNQPRMRATEISDDGKTMLFTFIDGTNMASRDVGHMDKAWFKFEAPDRFVSRWTFYKDGQERWMEDVVYTRVERPAR